MTKTVNSKARNTLPERLHKQIIKEMAENENKKPKKSQLKFV